VVKILGLMMQHYGFRSPQSSLTVDTKEVLSSPTFPTTETLAATLLGRARLETLRL